jgi:DNA-directed RNA polymerase specialized sigma subunit
MEREARRTVETVLEQIRQLPALDRRLLSLRFDKGWSARKISEELGIDDHRRVYTLLDRIIRSLRRKMKIVKSED